jgi:UDP-N-acetylglucosamine 1-carboxyvinyltransferase
MCDNGIPILRVNRHAKKALHSSHDLMSREKGYRVMKKFVITGGFPLQGEVTIQGAKNAAQKILPATIAFPGEYVLKNVPLIQDARALIDILIFLGGKVEFIGEHTLRINTENVCTKEIPPEVTATSTGTFLFAGALLSRFGEVKIWHPGGDRIGKRPVTWHLAAFEKLGASVVEEQSYYQVQAAKLTGNCTISFAKPTANGTVNAVIASVRAHGDTLIENVAPEPEIQNFLTFMQNIGANVKWIGENRIQVKGVKQGNGSGEIEIIPDRNDAATFILAATLGHGPVTLHPICQDHLRPLLDALKEVGVHFKASTPQGDQSLTVQCDELHATNLHITSRPYPGFSTDWGPMMQALMTQIPGKSFFHETIFSQRFAHMQEFIRMGAEIRYQDIPGADHLYNFVRTPGLFHAVQIQGPSRLHGAAVHANDVRAGAALVLGGLVAVGVTEVTGIEQIERGYEMFAERLNQLGASIEQI